MSNTTASRIVVIESWAVLRRGIVGVLHGPHVVVASAEDLHSGLAAIEERPTDLVVIGSCHDFRVDDVAAALERFEHRLPAIVLREQLNASELTGLLRRGMSAVLRQEVDDAELLDAVNRVLAGDRVIDQRFLPLLYEVETSAAAEPDASLLTPREMEVLELLSRGMGNRQIAESLYVGEATVKTHLAHIYEKLGVNDRHRAVGRALEAGLIR